MRSVVNESDFNVNNGIFAIKFWAPWCGPCQIIDKNIKKLVEEFENICFLSVDIDQVPTLAQIYKIRTIPTILLIEDSKEINRITGVPMIDPLRKVFRECVDGGQNIVGSVKNIDDLTTSPKGEVVKAMSG